MYARHKHDLISAARSGDTLTTTWTISGKTAKPKHGGGLVSLKGVCRNQDDEVVVEADAKLLVRNVQV